jgi:hypothetical protein
MSSGTIRVNIGGSWGRAVGVARIVGDGRPISLLRPMTIDVPKLVCRVHTLG